MKEAIDQAVIDAKLRELSRRLIRLRDKRPKSARQLADDQDLQDILARNLEIAVQSCTDIASHVCGAHRIVPTTADDSFVQLARLGMIDEPLSKAMQRAVGMRNVLAHDYADVDWTLVVKVLRDDLEDLANFGRVVIAWMNGQQG
jgi:uncharacterized protein YutE (UPF0331/DUF86 family)